MKVTKQFNRLDYLANPTKIKLTTTTGKPVRLVSAEGSSKYPIIGVVDDEVEEWTVEGCWSVGGPSVMPDMNLMMVVDAHYPSPRGSK